MFDGGPNHRIAFEVLRRFCEMLRSLISTGRLVRTTSAEPLRGEVQPHYVSRTRFRVFGWNIVSRFTMEYFAIVEA